MPKEATKKKKSVKPNIKQKQKQNISIIINSNNRSKKTTAPKQTPSQPQLHPPRNNPPVVNIMGDTRPQLGATSNYSGLGQQNRLFANDSALEQRLTRLLNLNNDQSVNLNPSLSNSKILSPQPARYRSPSPTKTKASPKGEVMDLNFFNTRRKAYEDQQKAINDEEEVRTPSVMDVVKGKFNNLFSPKTNEMPILGATILPSNNLLDDIKQEEDNEEKQDEKDELFEELQPIVPAGRKEWMKLRRLEKTDWAYDNQGTGANMVELSDDEIDHLRVKDLNALYDQVMLARAKIDAKQI